MNLDHRSVSPKKPWHAPLDLGPRFKQVHHNWLIIPIMSVASLLIGAGYYNTLMISPPDLYSFTSHTFTSANTTGKTGPNLATLTGVYPTWSTNPNFFSVGNQGVQIWTAPASYWYSITVAGASGATGGFIGGNGRIVSGRVWINQGQRLYIIVGQRGASQPWQAGGGGGSFVYLESISSSTYVLVAGGGGGGSQGGAGADGSTSTSGTAGGNGSGSCSQLGSAGGSGGAGGTGGNLSGTAGSSSTGVGGNGAAGCGPGGGGGGGAGLSTISGATFVGGTKPSTSAGDGGFGGGASSGGGCSGGGGSGGGGGFSGGGGGGGSCVSGGPGGGGGSAAGTMVIDYNNNVGTNSGEGYVTLQRN